MPETSNVVQLRPGVIKNAGMPDADVTDILDDQPMPEEQPALKSSEIALSSDAQMLDTAYTLYNTEGINNRVHVYDSATRLYKYTADSALLIVNELEPNDRLTSIPLPAADTSSEADYVIMFNEEAQEWGRFCASVQPLPQLYKFFTKVMRKEDWKRRVFNTEGSSKSMFLYSVRIPKDRHGAGVLPRVNLYVAVKGVPSDQGDGMTLLVGGIKGLGSRADEACDITADITSRQDTYILHHSDGSVEVQLLSLCSDSPVEIHGTTPEICITIRP